MAIFSRRTDDDFSAEVQAHLELEVDRLMADGMSAGEARAAARRAFGNVTRAKERFHETSRGMRLEQLGQDLRYGWRGMRHSPAVVATTVMTIAVGLALVTVAFTIFNAYVLRPFAIRDPGSLHQIAWRSRDSGGQSFRWRDYDDLRRRTDLFSAVIRERTRVVSLNDSRSWPRSSAQLLRRSAGDASAGLGSADAGGDGNPAVLSDQAWSRLFDRDPSALGRAIDLNGRAFTIVGVVGPSFTGLGDMPRDVFVPVRPEWDPPRGGTGNRLRETEITARLQPGVGAEQAAGTLTAFMAEATGQRDGIRAEIRPQSSPNALSAGLLMALSPVFAAFALVLIAACANVSNVMLARAIARSRGMAGRLSIGASRGRVVRQLVEACSSRLCGVRRLALAS